MGGTDPQIAHRRAREARAKELAALLAGVIDAATEPEGHITAHYLRECIADDHADTGIIYGLHTVKQEGFPLPAELRDQLINWIRNLVDDGWQEQYLTRLDGCKVSE